MSFSGTWKQIRWEIHTEFPLADTVDVVKGSAVLLCQNGELCKVEKKWAVYVMAFHTGGGEEQRDGLVHVSCNHIWDVHISLAHPPTQKRLYWLLQSSLFIFWGFAPLLWFAFWVFSRLKWWQRFKGKNPEKNIVEDALLEENYSDVSPKIQKIKKLQYNINEKIIGQIIVLERW